MGFPNYEGYHDGRSAALFSDKPASLFCPRQLTGRNPWVDAISARAEPAAGRSVTLFM
jgi:hypothetical protein